MTFRAPPRPRRRLGLTAGCGEGAGRTVSPAPATWRRTWAVLAIVAVVAPTVLLAFDHARSWHYFVDAAHLLRDSAADGGGLSLYDAHPELQFGPLVIVVALPFSWLPTTAGEWAVMAVGSLAGVTGLAVGVEAVRLRRPEHRRHDPRRGGGRRRALHRVVAPAVRVHDPRR